MQVYKNFPLSFLVLTMLIGGTVGSISAMSINMKWADPKDSYFYAPGGIRSSWKNKPCHVKSSLTANDYANNLLVGILTIDFSRGEGVLSGHEDFYELIAAHAGDSMGLSLLTPAGTLVYTAQYGHSTGILSSINYRCYVPNKKLLRPFYYDTVLVQKTEYDTLTVERVCCDSIIYVTKTLTDTVTLWVTKDYISPPINLSSKSLREAIRKRDRIHGTIITTLWCAVGGMLTSVGVYRIFVPSPNGWGG